MPEMTREPAVRVGFVALQGGETPDLFLLPRRAVPTSASEPEQSPVDPSGSVVARGAVGFPGTMRDLTDLIAHRKVELVVFDQSLPLSTSAEPEAGMGAHTQGGYVERVAEAVRGELEVLSLRYSDRGRSVDQLGTPSQVAQQMVRCLPAPSDWDSALGPFLSETALASRLRVTPEGLQSLRESRGLIGLRTREGRWVYPTFQLTDANEVSAGLPQLLGIIGDSADEWTVAGWLVSTAESLGGQSPIRALNSAHAQRVYELARDVAQRWRR